jgi:magnesium-transporting ATPase (P-type)
MRLPLRQVHLLAVTVFFAGVVLAQVGNAFAVRAPAARSRPRGWLSNFYLVGGVLAEALLVLALVYFRPLNELFGLHVLPPAYWLGLLAYAPLLYLLDRARGWFGREAGSNAAHEGGMSR